jgi:hypothetical protein
MTIKYSLVWLPESRFILIAHHRIKGADGGSAGGAGRGAVLNAAVLQKWERDPIKRRRRPPSQLKGWCRHKVRGPSAPANSAITYFLPSKIPSKSACRHMVMNCQSLLHSAFNQVLSYDSVRHFKLRFSGEATIKMAPARLLVNGFSSAAAILPYHHGNTYDALPY